MKAGRDASQAERVGRVREVGLAARVGRTEGLGLAALGVLASWLFLGNLGGSYLWQDEAQTALLARSVLENGLPLGFDGLNHFSQEFGAEYGADALWRWHTWLPLYLLAACFGLFGESEAVARLPFALAGLASVPLTWLLARTLWRDRRAAAAAAVVLALCVPFLILSRQSRYYGLAALLALLCVCGYWQLVRTDRVRGRGDGPLLALGLVLLFHTHYVYAASLLAAFLAHTLLWHRDRLVGLCGWTGLATLGCAPWIVWLSGMEYGQVYGDEILALGPSLQRAVAYLGKLGRHAFPPLLLGVPAVAVAARVGWGRGPELGRPGLWNPLSLLLLVLASTLAVLSLVSPGPFFRYLAPLLPVLALLIGRIASAAMVLHPAFGALVVAGVVLTRPLAGHVYELTHEFDGPIEGIVEHLRMHADEEDVVAITYGDLPLKFYTGLRVVGGLTGEDLTPAATADWVIIRHHMSDPEREGPVVRYFLRNVDPTRYRKIELDVTDTAFENREEPELHLFRTAEAGPRVTILQRIPEAQASGGD